MSSLLVCIDNPIMMRVVSYIFPRQNFRRRRRSWRRRRWCTTSWWQRPAWWSGRRRRPSTDTSRWPLGKLTGPRLKPPFASKKWNFNSKLQSMDTSRWRLGKLTGPRLKPPFLLPVQLFSYASSSTLHPRQRVSEWAQFRIATFSRSLEIASFLNKKLNSKFHEKQTEVQIPADDVLEDWLDPDWDSLSNCQCSFLSRKWKWNSKREKVKHSYQQMTSWKIDWAQIETSFPIANAAFWVKSESEIPWVE